MFNHTGPIQYHTESPTQCSATRQKKDKEGMRKREEGKKENKGGKEV